MDRELEAEVWRRAAGACEYCQMPQALAEARHQIDHIVALKHSGRTTSDHLALACFPCNNHKGPNLAGVDPTTGRRTWLYHPRRQRWARHSRWDGPRLVGRTAIGRSTIAVLAINHPNALAVREALILEGAFPLCGDLP